MKIVFLPRTRTMKQEAGAGVRSYFHGAEARHGGQPDKSLRTRAHHTPSACGATGLVVTERLTRCWALGGSSVINWRYRSLPPPPASLARFLGPCWVQASGPDWEVISSSWPLCHKAPGARLISRGRQVVSNLLKPISQTAGRVVIMSSGRLMDCFCPVSVRRLMSFFRLLWKTIRVICEFCYDRPPCNFLVQRVMKCPQYLTIPARNCRRFVRQVRNSRKWQRWLFICR